MAAHRGYLQRDRLHRRDRCAGHPRPGFLAGELTRTENASIARQLDAAISGGLRPTSLILHKQPQSKWNRLDFALYEAHAIWQNERSGTTGFPIWLTRSLDPAVNWRVEESIDQADAVLDAWDRDHSDRRDGASRWVVPVVDPGNEHLLEGGISREHHYVLNAELAAGADPDDESAGLDIERKMPPGGWNPADYG